MKWSQRLTSAVTAVCFVVLVALGVDYVVHTNPDRSGVVTAREPRAPGPRSATTSAASPAGSAHALPRPPGVTLSAQPSAQPSGRPATSRPPRAHRSHRTRAAHPSRRPAPIRPARPHRTRHLRPTATPAPAPPPTLDFVLTTFNVLGASHTTRGGTHARYASGRVRALRAAALIRRHHSDVVGFQELQGVQLATLERHTDLAFWPGFALRRPDTENSIGWRRGEWTAVDKQVVSIPYFDGGLRRMPVVRLRSVSTGLEAWFANFHNPAETSRFHHQQRYRTRATAIETRVANRLITATGLPVFVTGDMNERGAFFCRFTGRTPMVAARGGSNTGRCRPSGSGGIDWIFGSQGVDFSGYDVDRSHLVRITTDHPVVTAHVRITGDAKNPGVSGLVP